MTQDANADRPDVIARPPLLLLVAILAAIAGEYIWPLSFDSPDVVAWIGGALMLVAVGVVFGSAGYFRKKGTNVETWKPTENLVTTGLYAYSRNPIYLAFMEFFIGLGLASGNGWYFILLPALYLLLRYGVIAREETYLTGKFGDVYRGYQKKVRRWI